MDIEQRKAIVESGPIYLENGCRATLGGYADPYMCSVTSAYPGFWHIGWDALADIVARPDRRMTWTDNLFNAGWGWLGCIPAPRMDWQTDEDYAAAVARGDARKEG